LYILRWFFTFTKFGETCNYRNHHYKKVEQALKSFSITENSAKHKEINIKWLKNELQKAEEIIYQFQEWVDKYENEVKTSHNNKISQQKEF
jgi:hypothetical protein